MKLARLLPAIAVAGLIVSACGGSNNTTTTTATVPSDLSINSFTPDYSYMSKLTSLTAAGRGLVGVILPDTSTSGRYVAYDTPDLTKAAQMAGYTVGTNFKIDNAAGQESQELAIAQADITAGASVLIMDPLNSTVGSQIQALAQSHGVKVISYDRATFTGTNTYYVSFDNVQVGELIGKGFVQCVSDWKVSSPQVFELDGGQNSDPNAIDFAKGYNDAIWGSKTTPLSPGKTNSQGMTLVNEVIAEDWNNATGGAKFQAAYQPGSKINATVEANDGLANAVVQVLKGKGVGANKVPTTGQDASLDGMVNILQGYQCGTVYKAISIEAQDAVAVATVLRAGATLPTALLNGTTSPASGTSGTTQPASLLVPTWVTKSNIEATVIKDKVIDAPTLCGKVTQAVCTANGIS